MSHNIRYGGVESAHIKFNSLNFNSDFQSDAIWRIVCVLFFVVFSFLSFYPGVDARIRTHAHTHNWNWLLNTMFFFFCLRTLHSLSFSQLQSHSRAHTHTHSHKQKRKTLDKIAGVQLCSLHNSNAGMFFFVLFGSRFAFETNGLVLEVYLLYLSVGRANVHCGRLSLDEMREQLSSPVCA